MTENTEPTVTVPVSLVEDMRPEKPVRMRTAAMQAAVALIPKPVPRIVAVNLDELREAVNRGDHTLYADLDRLPDLMTVVEQAVEGWIMAPGEPDAGDADDLQYRIRTAIEEATKQ